MGPGRGAKLSGVIVRPALLAALLGAGLACRPQEGPPPRAVAPDPLAQLAGRCERGDAPACVEVAAAHRDAGDRERAAVHARRACDLASAHGCAALAELLEADGGDGKALELYVSACLGGHGPSCMSAAARLPAGEAAQFRARACAAGEASACPPTRSVEPAEPDIDPRDRAAVITALAAQRRALKACYVQALAGRPGLRGKVVVDIAVGPEGLARAVAVRETLRAAPEVGACVADVAAGTAYAPTTTGSIVVVPYSAVFEPDP